RHHQDLHSFPTRRSSDLITNWSKMGKRQITFNLSLTYDTPKEKIEHVVHSIRELLKNHSEIHQETIFVTVDQYEEYGLDIFLYLDRKSTRLNSSHVKISY